MIREIRREELQGLLALYTQLHHNPMPACTPELEALWEKILRDENHHIIVAEEEGKILSSCVCVIIPNLTRNVRPYAFIENVVTDSACRGKGYATECLNHAKQIAQAQGCYKLMLLTGSKSEKTLNFYRSAGYNSADKIAFIQWL